jgi:hypothetical protein
MHVSKRKAATLKALMERNLNLTMQQRSLLEEMTVNGKDNREKIEKIQDQIQENVDTIQDEIEEGYNDENIDVSFIFVERMSHDK